MTSSQNVEGRWEDQRYRCWNHFKLLEKPLKPHTVEGEQLKREQAGSMQAVH